MIAWWWACVAFLCGCVATFWFFSKIHAHVIKENMQLTEKNEYLYRRIQMIGERASDRSAQP